MTSPAFNASIVGSGATTEANAPMRRGIPHSLSGNVTTVEHLDILEANARSPTEGRKGSEEDLPLSELNCFSNPSMRWMEILRGLIRWKHP